MKMKEEKEKEELTFDFPEMVFTDEELGKTKDYKNKDKYEAMISENAMKEKSMVEEMKNAMESGKESGEILSKKTNIDGSQISEIYKGMGMAAGLTIGVGKVTKTMTEKISGKIIDKLSETKEVKEEEKEEKK